MSPHATDTPRALRVYFVGHTPIIRRLLVSAIESAGAELVGKSDSAQQATRELLDLRPDLIVFALVLSSGGTGFDVLEAIQQQTNTAPVTKIVLTSHSAIEHKDKCFRLGATHFFDKTYEAWRVVELINTMAAGRRGAPAKYAGGKRNDQH
jgi:DNA-binding NarL/FixJ family response regulator